MMLVYERQEQGISIGPARFRNLELSKELSNLVSSGYAIKNILWARNQNIQLEVFLLPSFRLHPLGRLKLLSHSHLLAPNLKRQSQESLRIPPRLS